MNGWEESYYLVDVDGTEVLYSRFVTPDGYMTQQFLPKLAPGTTVRYERKRIGLPPDPSIDVPSKS